MTLAVHTPEFVPVFDGAQSALLGGDRLHLNEGPIDLIIGLAPHLLSHDGSLPLRVPPAEAVPLPLASFVG